MFKFLFGKSGKSVKMETQRVTVVRALDEINSVLALMADKPVIGVDLNSGLITVDLPEQMPDEALALPAPQEDVKSATESKVANKAKLAAVDENQQTAA